MEILSSMKGVDITKMDGNLVFLGVFKIIFITFKQNLPNKAQQFQAEDSINID